MMAKIPTKFTPEFMARRRNETTLDRTRDKLALAAYVAAEKRRIRVESRAAFVFALIALGIIGWRLLS